jgi:hypothetical protein
VTVYKLTLPLFGKGSGRETACFLLGNWTMLSFKTEDFEVGTCLLYKP